jgi:tellurite resistance protein
VGHLRALPFALPFWAYTFPLAASAVAATAMAGQASGIGYDLVAGVLLALATVTALVVTAMTLRAASRGQICVPEQ